MDFKFIQDETDLSVGLSVTCSTTPDSFYGSDEDLLHQPTDNTLSSIFMMQYPPETDLHPVVQSSPDEFDQALLMNLQENNNNQRVQYKEEMSNIISLDSYRYEGQGNHSDVYDTPALRLHPDARKMQVCKSCGKTFKFQTSLLRHNNKVHMSRYQCMTCCRLFSRQSYLDVHTSKPGTSCYIEQKVLKKSRKRN